jgi:hypothetical protein
MEETQPAVRLNNRSGFATFIGKLIIIGTIR